MTFLEGKMCSRNAWRMSESLPRAIEKLEANPAPLIKDGFFGRKIGYSSIDEVINGMNLIVLDNYSAATLQKLQSYTRNFKQLLADNLGWKDRVLAHFGSQTQLTSERMAKLEILANKIDSVKKQAFVESRQPLPFNSEKNRILAENFKKFGLSPQANGYDLNKAFWTTGHSKEKLSAYNAIVKAKKWSLPRYTVQRMG